MLRYPEDIDYPLLYLLCGPPRLGVQVFLWMENNHD